MKPTDIPLPKSWPKCVGKAMIHVVSLAHWAFTHARAKAAVNPNPCARYAAERDQMRMELALIREQLRIVSARLSHVHARHRPHYLPAERNDILVLMAANGWFVEQTAAQLLLQPETIASWSGQLDKTGDTLLNPPPPVNKFPPYVDRVVQQLKTACPCLGRRKIAQLLTRGGLALSASTVLRRLRKPRHHTPRPDQPLKPCRKIVAKRPNHIWHIDLTILPTGKGFWCSWLPNSLIQRWPFCFWLAVIEDHFSRVAVAFAIFLKQPTARETRDFLSRATRAIHARPKHIITDKGKQFIAKTFRRYCRCKIRQRFGAVGKHGSIAVIERLIKSIKYDYLMRLPVFPLTLAGARYEVSCYIEWYNAFRPHDRLEGRTPMEVYTGQSPPRRRYPAKTEKTITVSFLHGRENLPIVALKKAG